MKHLFTLKRRLLGLLSLTALFVLISALPANATASRDASGVAFRTGEYIRYYYYKNHTTFSSNTGWQTATLYYPTVNDAANATVGSVAGAGSTGWVYYNAELDYYELYDGTKDANGNASTVVEMRANSTESFTIPSTITVKQDGYTLTVNGASTNNSTISGGPLTVNSGDTLTNAGTITMENNTLTLYGTLANSGTLTNTSGGTINIYGGALTITTGTTNSIAGTTNVGSPSSNYSGSLTVTSGTLTNTGTINVNKYNPNAGTLTVNGGTLANTTGTINNYNAITVSSGTLSNGATGTINNKNGGTTTVSGGSFTNAGTVTNDSGATVAVTGGTFSNTKTVTDNGAFNISAGNAVTNSGTFTIGATTGSLNLTNTTGTGFDNSGTLTNNGTLTGTGTLNNSKDFTNSGTYSLTGKVTNTADGTVNFNNGMNATIDDFDNLGTLNVSNSVQLTVAAGKTLTNETSGKINVENGSELSVAGTLSNAGTVTNNGALTTVTGGTIDITAGTVTNKGTLTNGAALTVDGGELINDATLVNSASGTFTVNKDGKFTNNGLFTDNGTTKYYGTLVVNGTWVINSTFDNYAKIEIGSKGTLTVSADGTLNNYNSIIIDAGGQLVNNGIVQNATTTDYTSPVITNSGSLTNSKTLNLTVGSFTNNSLLENTADGTITNEITLTNAATGTITNNGTLNNQGTAGKIANAGTLTNAGTLANTSTADAAIDNSGTLTNTDAGTLSGAGKLTNSKTFTNAGTYTLTGDVTNSGVATFKSGAALPSNLDNFNNTGKLYVSNNTKVTVEAAKTLTNAKGAEVIIEEGSELEIAGTLDNSGLVTDNGTLTNDTTGTITNQTGGDIEDNKTFTNNGKFDNLAGSIFTINGDFTDAGTSTYKGTVNLKKNWTVNNTFTNDGNIVIYDGATMTIAAAVDGVGAGTLINNKSIQIMKGGALVNNNVLTNNENAKITNDGTLQNKKTFTNSGSYINSSSFMNISGTFTNNASFTNAKTGTMTNAAAFNNDGTFVNAGSYIDQLTIDNNNFKGTLTNRKSIDNQAGATMTINGTLNTTEAVSTYNNDGTIEIKNAATLIDKTRTDGQAFSMTGAGTMTLDAGSIAKLGTESFIGNTADYDIQSAGNFTVTNAKFGVPTGNQQIIKSDATAVSINKNVTIPAGVVYDFRSATTTVNNVTGSNPATPAVVTVNGTFVDKASDNNMPSIAGPGKFVYNVGSYGYLGDLLLIDKTGAVMDLEKGTIEVTANTITLPSGADVTITQDWTNPADETFTIADGAVLGITSHTFTNAGALDVEGTMNVNNSGTYIIKDQGTEEVNGMINVKSAGVYKDSRANSTWTGEGTINYYDGSEGFLGETKYIGKKDDTAALMQLASGIIELKAPGTTVGDKTYTAGVMTLKANSEAFSNGFKLDANQLAVVEPGAKLSIANGATLNIDGDLVINDKGQVIVPNNTTYTIENAGTEQIDGKITVEDGGKFIDNRGENAVIKAGSLGYIEYMAGSEGYLGTTKYIGKDNTAKIALTSGSIKLDVLNAGAYANGEMTLVAGSKATSNDFASAAGQLMTIQKGATLDIYNNKSFTNNGDLVIDGTDGTLDVTAYGTYVNNGNQKVNGIIHVENNGTIKDNTAPYTVNGVVNTKVNGTTPAAGKIIYELGGMGYHGEDAYIGPKADTYPLQLTYGKIEQVYEEGFAGDHYTLTDGSKASANDYTLSGDETPDDVARHLTIAKNAELTVTKAKAITIDGTLTIDKEGKLIVPSTAIYNINEGGVEEINGEIILQRAQGGLVGGTFNDNREVPYMTGVGSIVYYSGAQGKVSGYLFIGGPKDTDADVQITDSDGALILHSGTVPHTTIYEVASGSEVTSNALTLRQGEKVTLHNAAMVTIPSGKSLTLLDPNSTSQVIFEPQPNNYVTTINLQGELIMNVNGKPLSFISEKPEYELLLKSLPTVNGASVTMPEARISNNSDSIIWSVNGNKDYAPGTTANITSDDTEVVAFLSSTAINTSSDVKVSVKDGSYANLVYGNFNEVDYIVSVPSSEKNAPTNSGLKNVVVKMTGANAADFWIEGSTNNVLTLDTINYGSSRNFTVITKKNGTDYLDADTYHATIVITGTDVLGRSITDSIQLKQVVLKNTPTLSALSASALTYGQTLSQSTVTGTATPATNTAALAAPVAGTYAFTDATLIPDVATEEYEVTFTPTDAKNYNIATGFTSVSVTPVDMSKVTLAPITDQPYTSNFVTPTLSLTYKGMPLVEYEDYQVVYGNNVELSTPNSPATVSIIGMGNYKGTLKSTFKIVNSDLLYFVSIPQVSGITSNPVAGTYYEYKGETFTFSLTLGKTYSKSAPVVKDTEGNVYKADANGIYSIKIDHSVILSIDGVTSNTTGIESLNGMKIWAVGHVLHIYTTKASPVLVVSMNGRMIVSDKLTVGDNSFNIDVEGTYIVKLGSQVVKIYVR